MQMADRLEKGRTKLTELASAKASAKASLDGAMVALAGASTHDPNLSTLEGNVVTAREALHAADINFAVEQASIGTLEAVADELSEVKRIVVGDDRRTLDESGGFANANEYLSAFANFHYRGVKDDRLMKIQAQGPSDAVNTRVGTQGGFAVPPTISTEIMAMDPGSPSYLGWTNQNTIAGNAMIYTKSEATPWSDTGVQARWEGEKEQRSESMIELERATLNLKGLSCLVNVTNEQLEDSTGIGQYIANEMRKAINWKTNEAIVNGTGASQPLGFAQSPAVIVVDAEPTQTDEILAINIWKMYARQLRPASARWLISAELWPYLGTMTVGTQPMWVPGNDMSNAPHGLLLGRPVFISDHVETLGKTGDLMFIDFGAYRTITKSSGTQLAQSMHLYFDYNMTTIRAITRVDGQPIMENPVEPARGTDTRSSFVALGARSL